MSRNPDIVLSASRRTDIPAFYLDWFMEQIRLGFFNIKNPYTKAIKKLNLEKERIHTIVFWSKNYDNLLRSGAGKTLKKLGFNLYFNFTINSESPILEGKLPSLKHRLDQFAQLASEFDPKTISWRFDPVCFYQTRHRGPIKNNLGDFQTIAQQAGKIGIKKCVTSFCDLYSKIHKRARFLSRENKSGTSVSNPMLAGGVFSDLVFSDPPEEKKIKIIQKMEKHLKKEGIGLFLCCEKKIFNCLDDDSSVQENACIDGAGFEKLFGGHPETKRDYGQRSKQGCKCSRAIDIGSYKNHPCLHDCLFCYANPAIDDRIKKSKIQ